jgi:hypothetical protein
MNKLFKPLMGLSLGVIAALSFSLSAAPAMASGGERDYGGHGDRYEEKWRSGESYEYEEAQEYEAPCEEAEYEAPYEEVEYEEEDVPCEEDVEFEEVEGIEDYEAPCEEEVIVEEPIIKQTTIVKPIINKVVIQRPVITKIYDMAPRNVATKIYRECDYGRSYEPCYEKESSFSYVKKASYEIETCGKWCGKGGTWNKYMGYEGKWGSDNYGRNNGNWGRYANYGYNRMGGHGGYRFI